MRAHFALFALSATLLPSGCAKIEARDLIRDGNALYAEGKHVQAIEKYNAAEELEPDGVTLYWNRACAAESLVLLMKSPEQRKQRAKYADLALRDFQTWLDRLDERSEEDRQQANDHRLALLDADERCDDLLAYWFEKHRGNPSEEALYGVIARTYARCGIAEKNYEWHVKRTEDFPESVRAWHALGIRKFEPLWPDPESGLPFNERVPPDERIRAANDVIKTLDHATALDPKFRDAYVWRSMAYTQRSLSRVIIENPKLPEEKLEAVLSREDLMLAWKQQKAVCDLEELPECPKDVKLKPEGPCCPPPPLTTEERARDLETRKALEQEIKAAEERQARRERRRRRRRR
jgi:tetratricopeptide (TPR) repeat protein